MGRKVEKEMKMAQKTAHHVKLFIRGKVFSDARGKVHKLCMLRMV